MLQRFEGDAGKRVRLEALAVQKMVAGNRELAEQLDSRIKLRMLKTNELLIEQNGSDNDVYFVFSGALNIVVNGRVVGRWSSCDHVGEMAAIEPTQRRAASVIATEETVVATITEPDLAELGARYPEIYRCIAKELSRRLHTYALKALYHWHETPRSQALPTLRILSSLYGLMRFDSQRRYRDGDPNDFMIAASALPVAHALFSDRKLANLVSDPRIGLNTFSDCIVISGFDEMAKYLTGRLDSHARGE